MSPATKSGTYFPTWLENRVVEIAAACREARQALHEHDDLGHTMTTKSTTEAYALWGCHEILSDVDENLRGMVENPPDYMGAGGSVDGALSWLGCRMTTAGLYLKLAYGERAGPLHTLVRSLASNLMDLSRRVDHERAAAIRRRAEGGVERFVRRGRSGSRPSTGRREEVVA